VQHLLQVGYPSCNPESTVLKNRRNSFNIAQVVYISNSNPSNARVIESKHIECTGDLMSNQDYDLFSRVLIDS